MVEGARLGGSDSLSIRPTEGQGSVEQYCEFESYSLRQLVRVIGDDDAGTRVAPQTPCLRGVLGDGPCEPEPETAGSGRGWRRSQCFSLLPSWAVRIRSRFA